MTSPAAAPGRSSDDVPNDRCLRCGRETPPGVSLCPADNPGKVKCPSTTQVHATILMGVIGGAIAVLLVLGQVSRPGGPYPVAAVDVAVGTDGLPSIVATVRNDGERRGVANCRVTRDGAPRQDDPTYRTEMIEPGAAVELRRTVPAVPEGTAPWDPERMSVVCT
ncbi:MAG: hypothetical protein ACKOTZ_02765 [Chloroflexota bacterium]